MREESSSIKFNPADYAYLDDIPLAGWMWEFIGRSPDYIERYKDIKRNSETAYLSTRSGRKIFHKYEWTISSDKNILRDKLGVNRGHFLYYYQVM